MNTPTRGFTCRVKHVLCMDSGRFETARTTQTPVRQMPHVAYRVDDIRAAAKGLKVLLEPFDAGMAVVGFYQTDDGAVVEFMQYPKGS